MASGTLWASHITEGIYLGRGQDAQNLEKLKEHGITHILNVADDVPNYYENEKEINGRSNLFNYRCLNVADFGAEIGGIGKYFKQASDFVKESGVSLKLLDEQN